MQAQSESQPGKQAGAGTASSDGGIESQDGRLLAVEGRCAARHRPTVSCRLTPTVESTKPATDEVVIRRHAQGRRSNRISG